MTADQEPESRADGRSDDDREPWEPVRFEVGQRVRVLARPECEYCREWHDQEVGQEGVIDAITHERWKMTRAANEGDTDFLAHHYWVELDDGVGGCSLSHFAAIELEPLPGAQEARARAEGA
jgi:hypothetical protein